MPQLMPLNWVFSSMMMLLLFLMSSIIFSKKLNLTNFDKILYKKSNMNLWFW